MAAKLFLIFAGVSCISAGIVDPKLQQKLFFGGGGGGTQNVLVSFSDSLKPIFDQVNGMNFADDNEKRTAQTDLQKQFTQTVQGPLQGFLQLQGINSESFWISNSMIVDNVNSRLVNAIANFPGVEKVEEEPVINLNFPVAVEEVDDESWRFARQSSGNDTPWGIKKIRAEETWEMGITGEGIVVAAIDTGVRVSHEALRSNYRSEYGWFDPYWSSSEPNDSQGHGTHVMGTINGQNGIGVAPAAQWIHCKGCGRFSCGGRQLLRCGQWVQCPTLPNGRSPDCSKAPHIVSNSWGGSGDSDWYDEVIKSWNNTGIIPVFALGNDGPNCNTAGSPGDRPLVIGVGSTDEDDKISRFSSLGPAKDDRIKPDIAAPGGQVRSAGHRGDTSYVTMSGTSMACPHVAGVVALMKQKNPAAKYEQIYDAITSSAVTNVDTSTARTCGDKPGTEFPNNVFGYGRVDAYDAVNAI